MSFNLHIEKEPCVYIVCNRRNGILYVGVTSALSLRMDQHVTGHFEGFTKRYGLKRLVYYEMHDLMDAAITREKQLKFWKRAWKVKLIESMNPEWFDLYDRVTSAVLEGPADLQRRKD